MAYVAPVTRATGVLITAAIWNQDIVDNVAHLASFKHGGVALSGVAASKDMGWYIGDYKYAASTAPSMGSLAWIICDSRNIGSAASGANVASNTLQSLFIHLWNNFANTELPIYDATGSITTRGVSAAADWAANKRLPLPDFRGRTPIGMDNPTSGAANRITAAWADVLGGNGGAENHTLSIAEMPAHSHNSILGLAGAGSAQFSGGGASGSTALGSQGGGGAHNNIQPSIAAGNWYIYTGN